MTTRPFPFALLALAVVAAVLAAPAFAVATPLVMDLNGPTALAPGQTAHYNVTATGGPAGNITYTASYYIQGTNTTGGSPTKSSPGSKSTNQTAFQINVTAPTLEQTLTLVVTVTASAPNQPAQNVTRTWTIQVVKAIVLTATFHNGGTTAAVDVTVTWYLDGALVGTSVVKQMPANADSTVTFNYLPVGLAAGQHTLRVEADLDHNGIIDPAKGEVVVSTIFFSQVQQPATGWTILLGIGVFIPVFLGIVALRRRGQR